MKRRGVVWLAGWAIAAVTLSCGSPGATNRTAAEEAVRAYYEALLRRDWPRAYAALHPDSRQHCSSAQFARQAQSYHKNLGFEPQEVKVRSCEEHGTVAVAHVVVLGPATAKHHSFQDAVTLRQGPEGWGVVLSPRFGEGR
jgi:hypothetical protein